MSTAAELDRRGSYMTLYDLYRYPTQHFDFHRRQLTLHDPG